MFQTPGYQSVLDPATNLSPRVVVVPKSTADPVKEREKYKAVLYGLGITEFVLGGISCIAATIAIAISLSYSYDGFFTNVGQGIWCGVILSASGKLGIRVQRYPSLYTYKANMTLSIIAANFMGILVILSGLAAAVSSHAIVSILHFIIAIIGFAGMIITIIHSACCCAGICCIQQRNYQGTVAEMAVYQLTHQPHQVVQVSNGQIMLVQSQPTAVQGHTIPSVPVTGSSVAHQAVSTVPQQEIPQGSAN